MSLRDHLQLCSVVELRAMARRHELRLQSLIKADILSQLERRILEWVDGKGYQTDLPEDARSVLARLVDANGRIPSSELQPHFGELRRALPGGIDSSQPWSDGRSTLLDLLHIWGLVFRTHPTAQTARKSALPLISADASPASRSAATETAPDPTNQDVILLPVDIVERLRPPGMVRARVFRPCAPPAIPAGASPYFRHDLILLASAIKAQPAGRLASGAIARRDLLRLNSHLLAPDDISDVRSERCARRLSLLRHLGEALGLLAVAEGRLVVGPEIDRWLGLSPDEQQSELLAAYVECSDWTAFDDLPQIQAVRPPDRTLLPDARRFLITLLSEAEPGEWYTFPSLVQAARSRNPFLLRRPGDGTVFKCAESGRDLTPRDWTLVEGAWIEAVVRGPLFWMGQVEPGRKSRGEISCFRIPVPGTTLPPEEAERLPTNHGDTVIVREDLGVEVAVETDLRRWFRLEQTCELVQRGPVSRYRISREKVRQRLQEGITHQEVLQDLGAELPAEVTSTIAGWANRFGQVRIFSATVVTTADAPLMNELRSAPEIGACLGEHLGLRVSTVLPGKVEEMIEWLRARGEMAHVEPAPAHVNLPDAAWQEIHEALTYWMAACRRSGEAGPSEATCRAVAALAGVQADAPDRPPAPGDAILALIEDAIRRRRPITFEYHDPAGRATGRITVAPRSMGQQNGVTYLAGYRKGAPQIDRFRLDCICNVGTIG